MFGLGASALGLVGQKYAVPQPNEALMPNRIIQGGNVSRNDDPEL